MEYSLLLRLRSSANNFKSPRYMNSLSNTELLISLYKLREVMSKDFARLKITKSHRRIHTARSVKRLAERCHSESAAI